MVEGLPSKYEVLSSSPNIAKSSVRREKTIELDSAPFCRQGNEAQRGHMVSIAMKQQSLNYT
jgi:hypothetical protein